MSTQRLAHLVMAAALALVTAALASQARAQDCGAMLNQSKCMQDPQVQADGIRHARNNEANLRAEEHAARQGLQRAQAQQQR